MIENQLFFVSKLQAQEGNQEDTESDHAAKYLGIGPLVDDTTPL